MPAPIDPAVVVAVVVSGIYLVAACLGAAWRDADPVERWRVIRRGPVVKGWPGKWCN